MRGFQSDNFGELAIFMSKKLSKTNFKTWTVIVWMLWNDKNKVVHADDAKPPITILEDMELWLSEYRQLHKVKDM